ncbi:MAG: hypothetical protein Q4D02_01315 [Clostridia bacterium]|nr:hypothetical protein [Clostridia bacterium]
MDKNILKDWYEFSQEHAQKLTQEDKKYLINSDIYAENILKNISKNNRKYVQKQFNNIADNLMVTSVTRMRRII